MSVPAGTRFGPYDIVAPLGAGGMGEVYRAIDTRLKRQVAIKILPSALAADPDRLARFQREAEVLASLNHANIAAVYGLEDPGPSTLREPQGRPEQSRGATSSEQVAVKALVMELVEGPTLADRIALGPIPIDETLSIARQIAAGLEAAHEQGIIHRDLKPANVKVRDDGTVKILDFGLAKLTDSGISSFASQANLSNSPTLTAAAMTGQGIILGTAAYMSPEQARGRPVDKRTDVWAFGAVLFEMLAGKRAFEGEDVTETMASVVKSTPNWAVFPSDVPPHIITLIQQCLEKDRIARIGDIAVARFLLSERAPVGAAPTALAPPASAGPSSWRRRLSWSLRTAAAGTLGAVLAGVLVASLLPGRRSSAVGVTRLEMGVAPADYLIGSRISGSVRPVHTALAISPDGRLAVFAASRGGVAQLFARAADRGEATPLAGTEGGTAPFFSPDGAWIGFWTGTTIKKVPANGGPAATIGEAPPGLTWGASWGDESIFFSTDAGISKVSAAGGTPTSVTKSDGERHLLPQPLPGGNALLFTRITEEDRSARRWEKSSVVLYALNGGEQRVLIPGGADARYVNTGHIVYMKTGTLMATPFDPGSSQVTGAPVALVEGVMQSANTPNTDDETGAGQFAISSSGTLLYATGGISPSLQSSPEWVDRSGAATPLTFAAAGSYLSPRVSPDGQRIAVASKRHLGENSDVWVYDAVRGAPTRVTFDGAHSPIWSSDGKRLLYAGASLYTISADGSGKPEPLPDTGGASSPTSWASGANTILYLRKTQSGSNGIWVLPMGGGAKPRLFLESRFDLWHPDLSPDGRWMAYVSFESGTPEVYVQAYPGPGEKIRISTEGGFDPLWTSDGRELLYRSQNLKTQQFFSAAIGTFSPLRINTPRLLFEVKAGVYDSTAPERSWHISPDGKRFLLLRSAPSTDKPVALMRLVLNWTEELMRLAPPK